jgi:hypothetical protein
MKNRLRILGQFALPLLFLLYCSQNVAAQCSLTGTNFTGTLNNPVYTGASNTFPLDADCEAKLPDPMLSVQGTNGFTAMINGNPTITNIGTVPSGGYMVGDQVTEPDIITFTYQVEVTGNGSTTVETMCVEAAFIDVTPPVFDMSQVPADITVSCPDDIPQAQTIMATDACSNGMITYLSDDDPALQRIHKGIKIRSLNLLLYWAISLLFLPGH